jgi:hypothetical protein
MCGVCTGETRDPCVCDDGACWYTMREKKLVDMEEELKISGEAQSKN